MQEIRLCFTFSKKHFHPKTKECLKFVVPNPIFNYSEGERIGILRKLSKKGLNFKTWEGELMLNAGMGTVKLDTFNFSVVNENIADSLLQYMGKEITLQYTEYLFVPYKIGNSNYIVNSFSKNE